MSLKQEIITDLRLGKVEEAKRLIHIIPKIDLTKPKERRAAETRGALILHQLRARILDQRK